MMSAAMKPGGDGETERGRGEEKKGEIRESEKAREREVERCRYGKIGKKRERERD